ncbi:MAG TPA: VWA domain-containing protein [Anaerolineae bacterium]|nr:VWA domain-containing protein [Anaerolineae bacterium]HNU03702.1 VWA domain-containing protein [Anaerolineae bacterium]
MSSKPKQSRAEQQAARQRSQRIGAIVISAMTLISFLCICGVVLSLFLRDSRPISQTPSAQENGRTASLTLASTPDKAELMRTLVDRFNAQQLRTTDRQPMQVQLVELTPDVMIEEALAGPTFQAMSPDSSIWLDQLDRRWSEAQQVEEGAIAPSLVGESVRFAISPVVIAAWEDVARSLGWPDQPTGWQEIQQRAAADPNFRWSHPGANVASGLLATLAEFYAGAGKTRGLTEQDATAQSTLDYVSAVERTVKFYGEGEAAIMQRIRQEGRAFLDAFVVQEHLVVNHNRQNSGDRLVALYPSEGTLWADHPLALLEAGNVTDNQRQTWRALRDFMQSAEAQRIVLESGFRPADLSVSLADSPIAAANGVDASQPQTTLQVPGPAVVDVVQNVWQFTKRKANIFLVVDTSGSMEGEKLAATQAALREFMAQIKGNEERVGLVEFGSTVNNIAPLDALANNRSQIERDIDRLQAYGNTALLDGVRTAYNRLQKLGDAERINAIVVMTDGRENNSLTTLSELQREIQRGNSQGTPVVIFAIAFGEDADYDVLRAIAESSGGQVRQGDLNTIRNLYRLLSSYF